MGMTAVGMTSRWMAANRALETESASPLFSDPFARELAGESGFAMKAAMSTTFAAGPEPYVSIRTKFFDDAVLKAVRESSITQLVVLAAGMDARAFRLDWPGGLTLFEVDRREVLDSKEAALRRMGAAPRCTRRPVRADLLADWVSPLLEAGFDPNRPGAILIEGLLMYLDTATVAELFLRLGTIAAEGSWIGLDVINWEMLESPIFAEHRKKLEASGCPWTFPMSEPESFLAQRGWRGIVVQPGQPEAHYGRWHYPVVTRMLRGIPRSYLVQGTRMSVDEVVQQSVQRYTPIREHGVVGTFGCPEGGGPFPGVLALGGSDGGVPAGYLDLLIPEGFACLALAYFGIEGTQSSLVEVPLERIERGLRWLSAHPKVTAQNGRVAVMGVSRGGELALLLAATFPDLVGPVVAYTPSSVVWPGVDFAQAGGRRSSWSYRDKPVPFMPYPEGARPVATERGWSSLAMCNDALDQVELVNAATIAVERSSGPLFLVSGGDDQMWPATRMCRMVVERMGVHGREEDVTHLDYPLAGHGLFPYMSPPDGSAAASLPFAVGGSPEAARTAHEDAWKRVIGHLRRAS